MKRHVRHLYHAWREGLGSAESAVEGHLAACLECAAYFRKMSSLLDADHRPGARLRPGPFRPVRISVSDRAGAILRKPSGFLPALRWSAAGALTALAVFIGVTLGNRSAPAQDEYTSSDLVGAYYSAVSQQSFTLRLETVVSTAQKATP